MNKKSTIVNQVVELSNGKQYLISYNYLYFDNDIPNNFLIFDMIKKPYKPLNVLDSAFSHLIGEILMENRRVRFSSNKEDEFVSKTRSNNKTKFLHYLKHHTNILGEVLHYNIITDYNLAYVLDNSKTFSKIFLFDPLDNFKIIDGLMDISVINAEFQFMTEVLSANDLHQDIIVQISKFQFMYISYINSSEKQYELSIININNNQYLLESLVLYKQKDGLIKASITKDKTNDIISKFSQKINYFKK